MLFGLCLKQKNVFIKQPTATILNTVLIVVI